MKPTKTTVTFLAFSIVLAAWTVCSGSSGRCSLPSTELAAGLDPQVVMGSRKVSDADGGITAIPTTFVIDRLDKVVAGIQGGAALSGFEAAIKLAL
jgi:hypothetical protein